MKYCVNCGAELKDGETFCTKCGKKVEGASNDQGSSQPNQPKKKFPAWAIVLIIVVGLPIVITIICLIIGVSVFSGVKDINEVIEENVKENTVTGTIGDTLKVNGLNITLDQAVKYDQIDITDTYSDTPSEGNIYLVLFLEVENTTDETEYLSSSSWTAYSDGYKSDSEIILGDVDGYKSISGDVAPGMKAKGYVAFEVPEDYDLVEANYQEFLSTGKAIFKIR